MWYELSKGRSRSSESVVCKEAREVCTVRGAERLKDGCHATSKSKII